MTTIIPFLLFCQALGALTGAGTTIWGEVTYIRAMRDGRIDDGERAHLRHIARGLRFGMTLLLLASFGLVCAAYLSNAALQPALSARYWLLVVCALLVTYVSWALSRNRISFAFGSALAFTGWWFLAYLTLGLLPDISFGATVAFFIVATGVFYGILQYARILAQPKP